MLARLSTGGLSAGPMIGDFPHERCPEPGLHSKLLPKDGVGLPIISPALLPPLPAEDWDADEVAERRLVCFGFGIAHGEAFLPLFGKLVEFGSRSKSDTDVAFFVGDDDGATIVFERVRGVWRDIAISDEAIMDARPPEGFAEGELSIDEIPLDPSDAFAGAIFDEDPNEGLLPAFLATCHPPEAQFSPPGVVASGDGPRAPEVS